MEKCRVNRITVNIDKKFDETIISLYKTNQLLATIDAYDLDIESFSNSGVSVKAYQAYCKDIVINLIDNGGIEGYYYDPKEEKDSIKYDQTSMIGACMDYVANIIGDKYTYKRTLTDEVLEMEQYNNKFIKNARQSVGVLVGDTARIQVICEIKSGQMCRPKVFTYREEEYTFNITNISRIVKKSS